MVKSSYLGSGISYNPQDINKIIDTILDQTYQSTSKPPPNDPTEVVGDMADNTQPPTIAPPNHSTEVIGVIGNNAQSADPIINPNKLPPLPANALQFDKQQGQALPDISSLPSIDNNNQNTDSVKYITDLINSGKNGGIPALANLEKQAKSSTSSTTQNIINNLKQISQPQVNNTSTTAQPDGSLPTNPDANAMIQNKPLNSQLEDTLGKYISQYVQRGMPSRPATSQ